MGKKVWEVSHEPFACSARYKYKAHADSGTESLHAPVVADCSSLDGFNSIRSSGLIFFLKELTGAFKAERVQSPAPVDPNLLCVLWDISD